MMELPVPGFNGFDLSESVRARLGFAQLVKTRQMSNGMSRVSAREVIMTGSKDHASAC